jgi:predicted dehydrogenase
MQSFVRLLQQGRLNLKPLVHKETDVEHAAQAYEQIANQSILGVILRYTAIHEQQEIPSYIDSNLLDKNIRFVPARSEKLRVGLVGAGGFAKIKLLPLMNKVDGIKINAIVDADMGNALSVSKLYGAARALSRDDELFENDLVDVVVIASPHRFHCDQAMRALKSGKAVFMEKPMVSDYEQYARFSTFLHRFSDAPLCVDYNRSFSPFMQKIKQAIEKRHSPLMVHYRMNAGYISKDHWIQSDIGAGRIIGEACHIIDLFCFLTDSKPLAVSVEAMHTAKDDIFPTDNFSAQITFQDGSICTLIYTSLGHNQLGKERMELFFDGKTIVMDDYAQLHGFGFPNTFHETTVNPDKGHEALINQFFDSIKKPTFTPPIHFDRLALVAHLTLVIDTLACQGGGTKEIK